MIGAINLPLCLIQKRICVSFDSFFLLQAVGVGVRLIIKCIFRKLDVGAWTGLMSHNRDRWRALVNAVMNLHVL